tara:strand:+ start:73044 stop:73556 length:513 start_codon:yes stop_codon:yes gene_type:complete
MSKLLTCSLLVAASFGFVACASDGEETPSQSALESSDNFQEAHNRLTASSEAHTSLVMSRNVLSEVTLDEVHFHGRSVDAIAEMKWQLQILGTCRSAEGELLDTSGAIAAVRDLRAELSAHQIGMVTMVDRTTAQAAELNFHARQAPLFEELEAHATSFAAMAESYNCAF